MKRQEQNKTKLDAFVNYFKWKLTNATIRWSAPNYRLKERTRSKPNRELSAVRFEKCVAFYYFFCPLLLLFLNVEC